MRTSLLLSPAFSESFQQSRVTHLSRPWPTQAVPQTWASAGQCPRERPPDSWGLQPELDTQSAQVSGRQREWARHVSRASHPGGLPISSCTEKREWGHVECQGQWTRFLLKSVPGLKYALCLTILRLLYPLWGNAVSHTQASEMLSYKNSLLNRPKRSFQTHRLKKKKTSKGKVFSTLTFSSATLHNSLRK